MTIITVTFELYKVDCEGKSMQINWKLPRAESIFSSRLTVIVSKYYLVVTFFFYEGFKLTTHFRMLSYDLTLGVEDGIELGIFSWTPS